jgi:hypothetical protein
VRDNRIPGKQELSDKYTQSGKPAISWASRRLKSDRFFTNDYRAEIYTQLGLDWIDDNSMLTVLRRHYPELSPALVGVDNAFAPWKQVG